jgi:hypothetical protein
LYEFWPFESDDRHDILWSAVRENGLLIPPAPRAAIAPDRLAQV